MKRVALRGLTVSVVLAAGMFVFVALHDGGSFSASWMSFLPATLMAGLAGLVGGAATALDESRWKRLGPVLAGFVASSGLVLAVLEVSYVMGMAGARTPLDGSSAMADQLERVRVHHAEVLVSALAWGAPVGFAVLARSRRWSLARSVLAGIAGSNVLVWASAAPFFQGLPQPTWLLGQWWFHPAAGTFVLLQPFLAPILLHGIIAREHTEEMS